MHHCENVLLFKEEFAQERTKLDPLDNLPSLPLPSYKIDLSTLTSCFSHGYPLYGREKQLGRALEFHRRHGRVRGAALCLKLTERSLAAAQAQGYDIVYAEATAFGSQKILRDKCVYSSC